MIVGLLNLSGSEIILVLTLFLILLGARRLPDFVEGLRQGLNQFKKATRQLGEDIADQLPAKHSTAWQAHPVLTLMTVILGVVCVILVLREFYK
jgi:Sec-independent protein translocase protein TatA